MWVTRDKNSDLSLWSVKPYRCGNVWWSQERPKLCYLPNIVSLVKLKWEDEPLEIEIVPKSTVDNFLAVNEKEFEEYRQEVIETDKKMGLIL